MRLCCICGKPFDGYGYNPVPITSAGICCRTCNDNLVIPRRLRDYEIARIQQEADALRTNAPTKHASTKLNALVGKPVIVELWDGSTERGVLHIDTVAAHFHSADVSGLDNTQIIGYYLDRGRQRGYLHFKKSHIVNVALDNNIVPPLPTIYLCNGENTHCSKINCVYSGGGCKYTTDIGCAVKIKGRTPSAANNSKGKTVYYDDEQSFVDDSEV